LSTAGAFGTGLSVSWRVQDSIRLRRRPAPPAAQASLGACAGARRYRWWV